MSEFAETNTHAGPNHHCSFASTGLPVLEPSGVGDESKHDIDELEKTTKISNATLSKDSVRSRGNELAI